MATDLWATMLIFKSVNAHVPPVEIFWDELEEFIGITASHKRKLLFRLRKRCGTINDNIQ